MTMPSAMTVGRTAEGHRIRVGGKGTMRESPAVREFAAQALDGGSGSLVLDLSACDYLDSTFLGCLVVLHKHYGRGCPARFAVAVPSESCRRLMALNKLETFLPIVGESPRVLGAEIPLPAPGSCSMDLGRHIMECHRQLAEAGGPNQVAFRRIADQLDHELVGTRAEAGGAAGLPNRPAAARLEEY